MTTTQIREHLAGVLEPISRDRFNLRANKGSIQIRVTDEPDGKSHITVSVYDPIKDTDLVLVVDIEKSDLIESALTDAPSCKK